MNFSLSEDWERLQTMVLMIKKKKDGSETNSDIRTRVHNNQQIEHK